MALTEKSKAVAEEDTLPKSSSAMPPEVLMFTADVELCAALFPFICHTPAAGMTTADPSATTAVVMAPATRLTCVTSFRLYLNVEYVPDATDTTLPLPTNSFAAMDRECVPELKSQNTCAGTSEVSVNLEPVTDMLELIDPVPRIRPAPVKVELATDNVPPVTSRSAPMVELEMVTMPPVPTVMCPREVLLLPSDTMTSALVTVMVVSMIHPSTVCTPLVTAWGVLMVTPAHDWASDPGTHSDRETHANSSRGTTVPLQ